MAREEDRPPPGPVDVPFPVGGLYKRAGYQRQPPHTTADCLNVRPFDTLEGRERGGARPGIIKAFTPALGSGNPIQLLAPVSVVATSGAVTRTLVAAANGAVSFSTNGTTFTGVSGTLNSSAPKLQAAEHNQKLYIADYRAVKVSGTNGVIAETNKLSAAGVDWTTLGISTSLDVCLVTGLPDSTYGTGTIGATFGVVTLSGGTWPSWVAGGALVVGGATYYVKTRDSDTQVTLASNLVTIAASSTYQVSKSPDDIFPISAVATGYITLTGTLPNASCSYQIGRRIKVFDATTNTLSSLVHTYGIPPVGCPLMCTYRDRLVLAGPDQVWYMSRSGDPTDFDYGADPNDVQRPVAGTTSDAGSIGEPI
ncbi:MAG: hypothetical protein FJZ90_20155, partial [Chloroflexi bacterium]|nr:hypothetical protein [Chloroflexota bacterium]